MFNTKIKWLTVSLINLAIVAFLGVILRSKILFAIPGIDFKNMLHAHSHFAFGGWITLCLFVLMTYEILPGHLSSRAIYKWILTAILTCAAGMLIAFPIQGYASFSIIFSTLFIFSTYIFSWVFMKDLLKSNSPKPVVILCIVSLLALVVSSVGPFTLAYIVASHSTNTLLYKDAIYTYLHFQYNGFFTLAVFALLFNHFKHALNDAQYRNMKRFAVMLSLSVLPTLCLSYLWHFENIVIRSLAVAGCGLLVFTLALFVKMMRSMRRCFETVNSFARKTGLLSMIAFALKTAVQIGIVFPTIGNEVFGDRPIIIGYLHLVMLGFVTLYLLTHLQQINFFESNLRKAKTGIIIFTIAVIANELVLMIQGLAAMLMVGGAITHGCCWVRPFACSPVRFS